MPGLISQSCVNSPVGSTLGNEKKKTTTMGRRGTLKRTRGGEIERITRLAGFMALKQSPPCKVWSLDKANVLATSRLWRRVVAEVMAKEFPQLEVVCL